MEIGGGKTSRVGFESGDPDYSSSVRGRVDEERHQEMREEIVTEDVGAEDSPERRVGRLGVVIRYRGDGDGRRLAAGLWMCCVTDATQLVRGIGEGHDGIFDGTPYGERPIEAGESAVCGIEDDSVEFGHIGGEQALGERVDGAEGRKVDMFGMEDDALTRLGRDTVEMSVQAGDGGCAFSRVAGGEDEVEGFGRWAGREEFIDEAATDGQSEAARQLVSIFLLSHTSSVPLS